MTGSQPVQPADSPAPKASSKAKAKDDADRPMTALEEAIDIGRTVLIAVAITLFVRFFFFQPFNIPSGSMKPTLLIGDFVLVDKVEYGYSRASLIWPMTRMPVHGRVLSDTPNTGEIVVFKNSADKNKDYIKRVIGTPGDTVQVQGGVLYVNGEQVKRELLQQPSHCNLGAGRIVTTMPVYRETLPNGVSYIIQECRGNSSVYDNTEAFVVPAGHYFLMGDNRDNSSDSRSDVVGYKPIPAGWEGEETIFHFVPLDQIVGKATRVAFSVDGDKAQIWEVWKWPFAIRYSRLMGSVE
ncbi:signal peptidase I [Parvularcula marina]|uniref:signal peptidase I n=1 Tax=Parvularcula marina TaxID=2292771 RepID=UPI0035123CC7